MLVLHSLWATPGELALWAEDSTTSDHIGHPFAAPTDRILTELGDGPRGAVARKATEGVLDLVLPTASGRPVPSAELATDAPTGRRTLREWQVPALWFSPELSLDLLHAEAGTEVISGASVRFFDRLASLASSLVVRGLVVPGLVAGCARWRPVLAGADAAAVRAFAAAMPALCRSGAPELSSADVLEGFLDTMVDTAVRRELTEVRLAGRRRTRGLVPAVTAWLSALVGADATVDRGDVDPAELANLADQLARWRSSGATASAVRACFRLAEPDEESTSWRLEFLLQSAEDPSLLVSAVDLWGNGAGAEVLGRLVEHPTQALLTGLGRASRLYPELDQHLRTSAPTGADLDADATLHFLRRAAPALSQAGFGVRLPSWWGRPSAGLGLRLHVESTPKVPGGVTQFGQNALLDYQWQLSLGDSELTEAELADLAAVKTPLVRLRGQWIEVDPARLAAAVKYLRSAGRGQMTAADVLGMGVSLPDRASDLPVLGVDANGWLGDLLSGQADRRLELVSPPSDFAATLRPYQERGLAWLSFLADLGLGACLADDMGLGKTVQLLALVAREKSLGQDKPTLLVCPMSVVGNWQREAARFAPVLSVRVHHGRDRLEVAELAEADLVITTFALTHRDLDVLSGVSWRRVAVDEAQYIKNSATRSAKAVRQLTAEHRVALTGTPVENRLGELWSILDFTNPGLLGSSSAFQRRFAQPIEKSGNDDAAELLKRITAPVILRRLKTDSTIISDLPDKIEMNEFCTLTVEQASLYRAVVDDMMGRVENAEGDMSRRGLILATMTRLKQICNHPAHFLQDGSRLAGRSGKLARLEEILTEVVAEGDRALCFTQFAEFGSMLTTHLTAHLGQPVWFLHGGTPKKQRDAMVSKFGESDGPGVFVLSLKAGGTGLNLTAANHVIHVDRWWNPAVEDQATDRAFRIGQRKNVQVRKFVCAGTLEERIDAMITRKKELAQRIVGTGESWLTELSTEELRDMVTLSADAIGE